MQLTDFFKNAQSYPLKEQLIRGGVGSVILKIIGTFLSLASAVVLARLLGVEDYGLYVYILAVITILSIPAQAGIKTLVTRETARSHAIRDWSLMRGIWRWAVIAVGVMALVIAVTSGLVAWIWSGDFEDKKLATFAWGVALIPVLSLCALRAAALRGLRRVLLSQLPEPVIIPAALVILVSLYAWVAQPSEVTSSHAMISHLLSAALAYIVGTWLLLKSRPQEVFLRSGPCVYKTREWIHAIGPLALISGMQVVNKYTGLIVLGIFQDAGDVGIYRVVLYGGTLAVFGLQALSIVVAPYIARLYTEGNIEKLQLVATYTARGSLVMSLPVAFVFIFWGGDVLAFAFGEEFRAGHAAIGIVALGQLVNASVGSVVYVLNMTGFERDAAKGVGVAAICSLILNILLIPYFGLIGAAIAQTATLCIWNVLLWFYARSRVGISSDIIGRLPG